MSMDSLHRRINKMLAAIEQQRPVERPLHTFRKHLFTSTEQDQLDTLLLSLPAIRDNDLSELTNEQLDQLENWLLLEQALDSEDATAAAIYRRYLAISQEQFVEDFLALDENSIPDFDQAPTFTDSTGASHTLYRTHFRSARARIERQLKRGSLLPGDLDDIRMWLEVFSPAAA